MNSPDCPDLYTDKHERIIIERRKLGSTNELDWSACCHTNMGLAAAEEIVRDFSDVKEPTVEYRIQPMESGL